MKPHHRPTIAVILVNLGTPDAPTVPAVRRYLRQFLSDTRVVEIPPLLWAIILNLFVLPIRSKRVAQAYASIWDGDSPIRRILFQQASALQQRFDEQAERLPFKVQVCAAMTYGNPALSQVLDELSEQGVEQMVILPLYPQYSASTTGAVFDGVARWGMGKRHLPAISFVKDYFAHPNYIQALADSVRRYQAEHGKADKLLMSFHGIPKVNEDKGDPYAKQCRYVAHKLAQALQLSEEEWLCAFQSRFGQQEWVKPYTDVVLTEWGQHGVASVQIISPAFSSDCLETLEELVVENRHTFLHAGGQSYGYIPALNADQAHIDLLVELTMPHVSAWQQTLTGWGGCLNS